MKVLKTVRYKKLSMKHKEGWTEQTETFAEHAVENALKQAGLLDVEAPREGTPAYERLLETAINYMEEVKRGIARQVPASSRDSENYFSSRRGNVSSSDTKRREYHDQLCTMLLGRTRKEISKDTADRVSDFAAYVTENKEYAGTW